MIVTLLFKWSCASFTLHSYVYRKRSIQRVHGTETLKTYIGLGLGLEGLTATPAVVDLFSHIKKLISNECIIN